MFRGTNTSATVTVTVTNTCTSVTVTNTCTTVTTQVPQHLHPVLLLLHQPPVQPDPGPPLLTGNLFRTVILKSDKTHVFCSDLHASSHPGPGPARAVPAPAGPAPAVPVPALRGLGAVRRPDKLLQLLQVVRTHSEGVRIMSCTILFQADPEADRRPRRGQEVLCREGRVLQGWGWWRAGSGTTGTTNPRGGRK